MNKVTFDYSSVPPLLTGIISEDLDYDGTTINVSQMFIFNRDNGGSMRIEVEAHKNYEEATLMFNDTTVYSICKGYLFSYSSLGCFEEWQ